jgi:dihydroxyacid dehydratase/phosphogluconate dehydratase
MPAIIMALCRLNIPGMMLYGGSIAPGKLKGTDGSTKDITILNVFEAIGSHAAGALDDAGLEAIEAAACPGAGACGGQFTANTMAMAAEILGIAPIQLSGVPATSPAKFEASRLAGHMLMKAVRDNRRPSDIITRASIENAIASIAASGGSTNGVLHFPSSATSRPPASTLPRTTRQQVVRACWLCACSTPACSMAMRSPSAARRLAKKRRRQSRHPGSRSSSLLRRRSNPTVAWSF